MKKVKQLSVDINKQKIYFFCFLDPTEMKYELAAVDDDDEDFEFQFCVDDSEYIEVLRELKGDLECAGSDLENDSEIKTNCPHLGCKRAFSRKHNLLKHLKSESLLS